MQFSPFNRVAIDVSQMGKAVEIRVLSNLTEDLLHYQDLFLVQFHS